MRIAAYALAKQSKPRINQKGQIIIIEVTKSDFVVDKKNCETVMIDVAVSPDFSAIDKEREKKYQILVIEIYHLLQFPFLVCC